MYQSHYIYQQNNYKIWFQKRADTNIYSISKAPFFQPVAASRKKEWHENRIRKGPKKTLPKLMAIYMNTMPYQNHNYPNSL